MQDLDDIFTHIEILKSREPHVNEPRVLSCPFSDMMEKPTSPIKDNSLCAILQTICQRKYNDDPIFKEDTRDGRFWAHFLMNGYEGEALSSSKKSAKQLAAKNLLLSIIERGQHKEFYMFGETAEQARQYINSLRTDLDTEEPNWISKCNEMCQKNKLRMPKFDYSEQLDGKSKIFFCTVTIEHFEGKGTNRTKKGAQNLACRELYQKMAQEYGELQSRPQTPLSSSTSPVKVKSPILSTCTSESSLNASSKSRPNVLTPNYIASIANSNDLADLLKHIVENPTAPGNYFGYEIALKSMAKLNDPVVAKVFDFSSADSLEYTFADYPDDEEEHIMFMRVDKMRVCQQNDKTRVCQQMSKFILYGKTFSENCKIYLILKNTDMMQLYKNVRQL